jgi:hypothetical protein
MSDDVHYLVVPDDDDFDPGYVPVPEDEEDTDWDEHGDVPESV